MRHLRFSGLGVGWDLHGVGRESGVVSNLCHDVDGGCHIGGDDAANNCGADVVHGSQASCGVVPSCFLEDSKHPFAMMKN